MMQVRNNWANNGKVQTVFSTLLVLKSAFKIIQSHPLHSAQEDYPDKGKTGLHGA